MSNTGETINDLIHKVAEIGQPLSIGDDIAEQERQKLILAAEELLIAARKPEENVYLTATQIAQNAAYRCAIAMGVFDAMPDHPESIDSVTLATKLNVDQTLLERILRACTSTHLFRETRPLRYTHSRLSRAFIAPTNRLMMAQMYDFTSKGVFVLPEFLAARHWRDAGSYTDGPFQLGARTHLGFWEYLYDVPERLRLFSEGMRSPTTVGHGRLSRAYPFAEELGQGCEEGEVLIVDVGGGRGQSLEAIRGENPGLKGRFVLQDVQHVIEDGKAKGLADFIEPVVGSFFEPQKIKGARIYYFRRIFHDWGDEKSRQILENTKEAMSGQSRIIIADMVLPEWHVSREQALQDLNMMSFGGMERTEQQWRQLISDSGLRIWKIWKSPDGPKHAAIEVVLP